MIYTFVRAKIRQLYFLKQFTVFGAIVLYFGIRYNIFLTFSGFMPANIKPDS